MTNAFSEKCSRRSLAMFFFAMSLSPAVLAQATQNFLIGVHGGTGGGGGDPSAVSLVSTSTAALTILDTPNGVGGGLGGIAVGASDVYVAVAGGSPGRLITIDPITGSMLTDIGDFIDVASGEGCGIGDLAMHPNGTLYGITANPGGDQCGIADNGGWLVTINTATAAVTIIGKDSSLSNDQGGLAITSDGTLYYKLGWSGSARENNELYTLDPATGAFLSTIILDTTFSVLGLGAAPDGTLYASYWQDNDEALWTIDPATGNVTRIGTTVALGSTPAFVQDVAWFGSITAGTAGTAATATPVPVMPLWLLALMGGLVSFFGIRALRR